MRIFGLFIVLACMTGYPAVAEEAAERLTEIEVVTTEEREQPRVKIRTNHGDIVLKLYPDKAPVTVENFLHYVADDFFSGTIFHRVIPGFMIQGGGFDADMNQRPTRPPIQNEADNNLRNTRGTIAMARTQVIDSATSQFFINLTDNPALDHRDRSLMGFGYCVFGRVVEGMDVVDRIAQVPTSRHGRHENVPVEPVIIESIEAIE